MFPSLPIADVVAIKPLTEGAGDGLLAFEIAAVIACAKWLLTRKSTSAKSDAYTLWYVVNIAFGVGDLHRARSKNRSI